MADFVTLNEFTQALQSAVDRGRSGAFFLTSPDQHSAMITLSAGRITGVTRFGAFIRLAETGADGLVPISKLGDDFFRHDEAAHALVGERTGATYRLGMDVTVRLVEATPVTGGLLLEILTPPESGKRPSKGRRSGPRPQKGGPGRKSSKKPKARR